MPHHRGMEGVIVLEPISCRRGPSTPVSAHLDLGPLIHARQGLLEAGLVEPHHHLLTDDDYWNAARSGYLDHLLKGFSILTDIMLSKDDPLLRKELFRRGAVGSGGGRIDRYFLHCSLLSGEVTPQIDRP